MKHKVKTRTLGRDAAHRLAMLRNMARSLIQAGQIETTHTRALELKSFIEKLITKAKKGDLAAKRHIFSNIGCNDDAYRFLDMVKAQYAEKNGGYTSIVKYRFRKGDGAPIVVLRLL
ncbi:MAG: 50S ribosomal protein L17 [bacterium]|nr:50S ribosomal protein L17 [bacterium]